MRTAERGGQGLPGGRPAGRVPARPPGRRAPGAWRRGQPHGRIVAWALLGAILLVALGLRVWGITHGLPYAYNIDEADQFVPRAIEMGGFSLNPHYFANPPALTYLLHLIYTLYYGGHAAAAGAFQTHPGGVYEIGRLTVAALGVLAVWFAYLLGGELYDRRHGLVAGALSAVAFLPSFYSHLALNDVPALAALTLSLLGAARAQRTGAGRDFALAGVALGVAAGTKYTAGIAILALIPAMLARTGGGRIDRARLYGGALALLLAALSFLAVNPYALLDAHAFLAELAHESAIAGEGAGKLGAPRGPAILYYLWSFSWGLGWAPALGALAGIAIALGRRDRSLALLLPMAIAYLAFMGLQGRAFGRWLIPVLPAAAIYAAVALVWLSRLALRLPERAGRVARSVLGGELALVALVLGFGAQGAVHDIHDDLVLSRTDTRTLARRWLAAHTSADARIVVEPGVVEAAWLRVSPAPGAISKVPNRWQNYPYTKWLIVPAGGSGGSAPGARAARWRFLRYYPREEDYVRTLYPGLIDYYEQAGYCYVVSGSTQSGRAFADPRALPGAVAYYRALGRRGRLLYRARPFAEGAAAVPFSFDFSYDYYPLSYSRPGPVISIYRLLGGRCASS
jgi:hypothetical protein